MTIGSVPVSALEEHSRNVDGCLNARNQGANAGLFKIIGASNSLFSQIGSFAVFGYIFLSHFFTSRFVFLIF